MISSALKAFSAQQENSTYPPSDVPTLEEYFYMFYTNENLEGFGQDFTVSELVPLMTQSVQNIEKQLAVARRHLKNMEMAEEIVRLLVQYEEEQPAKKKMNSNNKIYLNKMADQLFQLATADSADIEEKLDLLETIGNNYPLFDTIAALAMDVAMHFEEVSKYLAPVSDKVRNVVLLVFRKIMAYDDPTELKHLEAKVDEVLTSFTVKDHEDLTFVAVKLIESGSISTEDHDALVSQLIGGFRETLKY